MSGGSADDERRDDAEAGPDRLTNREVCPAERAEVEPAGLTQLSGQERAAATEIG
jgi:hypothetical protein